MSVVPTTNDHSEKEPHGNKAQRTEEPEYRPAAPTVVLRAVVSGSECAANSRSQGENPLEPTHSWTGPVNAFSTLVIAFFTIVTAVAMFFQVNAYRRAERAWLSVDVLGEYAPQNFGDAALWLVSPTVRNGGRTPARIRKMGLNLNPITQGGALPAEPKYRNVHSWEIVQPPGKDYQPLNATVVKSDVTRVAMGAGSLYLWGFVAYEDAWGKTRETRFCFLYVHEGGGIRSGFYLAPEAPEAYTLCT